MAMGSRKNRKKKREQRHQVGAHLLSLSSQELPSDGNACLQLGIELSERQDFYRAVSALAKAAEMLPEVAQVWVEYAFALGSANRMKAAKRAYA